MTTRTELTDTLIALIPEDGSRISNAEIKAALEKEAGDSLSEAELKELKSRVIAMEAAEAAMGHIELARWADLVLVAPATANTMARIAHDLADDLLTTLVLATTAPLAVAPAMNQQMWQAAATQANLTTLRARGVWILGPGEGSQACGEVGPGRMLEPAEIALRACSLLASGVLSGRRIVVTAGPT